MTKTISVYFNGTDESNDVPEYGSISLAALLDHLTVKDDTNFFSTCVTGCGIENKNTRDLGALFTFHLEEQVSQIAEQVERMVQESNDKVILNVYGFSRGGVAAFLLCQKLKHIAKDQLMINVASFEPVPGNLITGVYGDLLLGTHSTLSASVADLTECKNIANMLILFTNQPLPDLTCHAPILPALPSTCHSDVDVTPGCHKNAVSFYKKGQSINPTNEESAIVFHRIVEFMHQHGTSFDTDRLNLDRDLVCPDHNNKQKLLSLYSLLRQVTSFTDNSHNRAMHLHNTIFTDKNNTHNKQYLNRYHQQLCKVKNINDDDCLLTIDHRNPQRMNPHLRHAIQLMELVFLVAMFAMIYNKYVTEPNLDHQFHPRF